MLETKLKNNKRYHPEEYKKEEGKKNRQKPISNIVYLIHLNKFTYGSVLRAHYW